MKREQHGMAPDQSPVVMLILDVLTDFRFPQGDEVLRAARLISAHIARLKTRAREAGIAVCYVNDNPGRWRSDLPALLDQATGPEARGRDVVDQLRPEAADYVILKPRHSAFYATPLDVVLNHLGARTLILTGLTSHQCILFTANDAHVRNFDLVIPRDCIGAPSAAETQFALTYFGSVLEANTKTSARLNLATLKRRTRADTMKPAPKRHR
jgi:isochorismate hydrolase